MHQEFQRHLETITPKPEKKFKPISPERLLQSRLEVERKETAEDIAKNGDFFAIREKLIAKKSVDSDGNSVNLLEEQKIRVLSENWHVFENISFLSEEDKEALTILELFHKPTFEHSLKTYLIAQEKLNKKINTPEGKIVLADFIKKEGRVSIEEFYRACLLHDLGKINVPKFILESKIQDIEWAEMLLDYSKTNNQLLFQRAIDEAIKLTGEEKHEARSLYEGWINAANSVGKQEEYKNRLLEFLQENKIRCVKYVPISEAAGNPILGLNAFTQENMAELTRTGFSPDKSLLEIIKLHESHSEEIVQYLDKDKVGVQDKDEEKDTNESEKKSNVAWLVGVHHDYKGTLRLGETQWPYTISSLELSNITAHLMKIGDMISAFTQDRGYHDHYSHIEASIKAAEMIDGKSVSFEAAYLWFSDDLEELRKNPDANPEKIFELSSYVESFRMQYRDAA